MLQQSAQDPTAEAVAREPGGNAGRCWELEDLGDMGPVQNMKNMKNRPNKLIIRYNYDIISWAN